MGQSHRICPTHISPAEMAAIARLSLVPCNRLALVQRPVVRQWTQTGVRALATTPASRDIDSAAKFIGAGAATVGVAGSGAGIGSVFVPSSLAMPGTPA